MTKRILAILFGFTLLVAACGDDDDASTVDPEGTDEDMTDEDMTDEDMTDEDMTDEDMTDEDMTEPMTGPASITVEDQTGDGSTVTVASVTLPTSGFIAVHAGDSGAPGAVIGHSEVLPEGESTDVEVTLDTALDADTMVFPMAHVDANDNGVYEFGEGGEDIDLPATTEAGEVAVAGLEYTIG
jgi:hypothetical protein